MELNLKCERFNENLIKRRDDDVLGGVQYLFRFKNNYGASVIKHRVSYGHDRDLWELAVIIFETDDNDSWNLTYQTSITCDVIGYLTDEEVEKLLEQIKEL